MVKNTDPLVSVCCITFNHEKFIRDAIDGFLMQKTDFPIEIIIRDDASTDATAEIVRDYQSKHPEIIHTIMHTQNQYTLGKRAFPEVFSMARGKYIALCEGDDYWTDPLKLQKQVDFMESHKDCSMCFHRSYVFDQDSGMKTVWKPVYQPKKKLYGLEDILRSNFIATATIVFRNGFFNKKPEWMNLTQRSDWVLCIFLAQNGSVGFLDQIMSVYRVHSGGMYSGADIETRYTKNLITTQLLLDNLEPKYNQVIRLGLSEYLDNLASLCADKNDLNTAKNYFLEGLRILPISVKIRFLTKIYIFCRLFIPNLFNCLEKMKDKLNKSAIW